MTFTDYIRMFMECYISHNSGTTYEMNVIKSSVLKYFGAMCLVFNMDTLLCIVTE